MEKHPRKTVNVILEDDRDSGILDEKKVELHSYAQEMLTNVEYRQQFKVRETKRENP